MLLSPAQVNSIRHSDARINVWDGAVRSGKTFASVLAWVRWIPTAPPGPLAMIGRTIDTLRRNVLDVIQDLDRRAIAPYHGNARSVRIMGRQVHLFGASDSRAEGKIRGLTLAGAYVDEATLMPETMWIQLLARVSVPGSRVFATTNPDSPEHWLKKDFIDHAHDKGLRRFHFTMIDNPGLDPEYVKAVSAQFTGLWHRRFIQGLWVAAKGAIYDMWDPAHHVIPWKALPDMQALWATGIDYGTQNATSAIILGQGVDGDLYLVDEYRIDASNRGPNRWTDGQQSEAIMRWLREEEHAPRYDYAPRFTVVDPAAASFKTQLIRDKAWGLHNADNDVAYGIRVMASLLMAGALHVADRCTGFTTEAPGYAWDDKAALKGEEKPIKVADHSLDAARYAVVTTETQWRRTVDQWILTHPQAAPTLLDPKGDAATLIASV